MENATNAICQKIRRNKIWVVIIMLLYAVAVTNSISPADAAGRSQSGIDALKFLDATAREAGLASGVIEPKHGEDKTLGIVANIINVILGFVGIIFFIQIFWAGFRWMTSAGNEEVISGAKSTIKTAVIGIVVVFSSFMITNFVLNQLKTMQGSLSSIQGDSPTSALIKATGLCEIIFSDEDEPWVCSGNDVESYSAHTERGCNFLATVINQSTWRSIRACDVRWNKTPSSSEQVGPCKIILHDEDKPWICSDTDMRTYTELSEKEW